MTTPLLAGPGRTLECINPKFMVDLVQGGDAARHPRLGPQQLQFRERLTQEIMTHTRLRPWAMAGMLNENAGCVWVWRKNWPACLIRVISR